MTPKTNISLLKKTIKVNDLMLKATDLSNPETMIISNTFYNSKKFEN